MVTIVTIVTMVTSYHIICNYLHLHTDEKTVSMYREIMEDVPMKYKLPRQVKTCTKTLENFVNKMKNLAKEWLVI